ncbi:hypothetical protein LguiB_020986 [Lonicera macranthoides]
MRLNKAPKEKLKSQPRKVKFEDEWNSGVTNRRHGGEVGESRIRDNNMGSIKKKTPLNDPEEWHKLGKMMEAYIEFHMRGSEEPSPNASSCKSNHCKEEEKPTISMPLSENKPKIDEIEEIEVTTEEGELWFEGVVPSLQEEEGEEVIVQVKENYIEESQLILIEGRVNKQETSTNIAGLDNISTEEEGDVRAELKIDNVEHIDFIGVDRFDTRLQLDLLALGLPQRTILAASNLYERDDTYTFMLMWATHKAVQKVLRIREGTIREWLMCNPDIEVEL